jgi:hypothetical protein
VVFEALSESEDKTSVSGGLVTLSVHQSHSECASKQQEYEGTIDSHLDRKQKTNKNKDSYLRERVHNNSVRGQNLKGEEDLHQQSLDSGPPLITMS